MICNEAHDLLHGYVDGELDVVRSVEVEEHLQGCRVCSQRLTNLRALGGALRHSALYHAAPVLLRQRILESVESPVAVTAHRQFPWRSLAIAASILFVSTLGWTILQTAPHGVESIASQITSAHIRSMMADHLSDVVSTDQHTVKPWFNGKVNFSPPVIDAATEGFPLVGGRLDYVDGHPAAALIYERRKHKVNLFVWPEQGAADSVPGQSHLRGYNLLHWTKDGMNFWAISDVNGRELEQFANLLRK